MHPENRPIADAFTEIADLLELQRADPVRVRAYRKASHAVSGLASSVRALARNEGRLRELPALGEALVNTAIEIAETGACATLHRLHAEVPQDVSELLQMPHLGPQRVRSLHEELGVSTLQQLHDAALAGRLQSLAGFGPRLEQQILKHTSSTLSRIRRFRLDAADPVAQGLRQWLAALEPVQRVELAGSLRRGCDSVADVTFAVESRADAQVIAAVAAHPDVRAVPYSGRARIGVVLEGGLQVGVHVAAPESFGACWLAATGAPAHLRQLGRRARARRLTLDESGVRRGTSRLEAHDEDAIYRTLGLEFIAPELREDAGELEAAADGTLPQLIERGDLRGDLRVCTRNGSSELALEELVRASRAAGLSYVAVADNARRVDPGRSDGNDLDRLVRQMARIDALNARMDDFVILKGVHADIREDGSLNIPDEVLRTADLVVGTISYHFDLSRARQTARVLRAMDNRYFSILGAPTGRLIEERRPAALNLVRVLQQARERGCFVELDSDPARLDLDAEGCRLAKSAGVPVCIASASRGDASGFERLRHGVAQARRGWLEKADVLNTRPAHEVRARLAATMSG